MNKKSIVFSFLAGVFVVAGLVAGVLLVKQQQDIRSKAACPNLGWLENGTTTGDLRQPTFNWTWENNSYGGSGLHVNLYLWDCAARDTSCQVAFASDASGTPITSMPFSKLGHAALTCGKTYYWYAYAGDSCTPSMAKDNTWWTFTVPACPPPPPVPIVCLPITSSPDSAIVTAAGETRTLTQGTTGQGTTYYDWQASGGTLSSSSEKTVTWTAPALGAASETWTITSKVWDDRGPDFPGPGGICTKVLSYTPPGLPTCDSLALTPGGTTVTTSGETRSLTARGSGGSGGLVYQWTTSGGALSATTGQTVTWTAPTLGNSSANWTVSAIATDSLGQTSAVGGCTTTLTYTYIPPAPVGACQRVEADKDLAAIKIGDTVTFTGSGTISNAAVDDSIDKIEFTVLRDNREALKKEVTTAPGDPGVWKASQAFTVTESGSYSVRIRSHWKSKNTWHE